MVGNQKEIEDDNEIVINGLLDVDPYDLDDQHCIIRSAVDDIRVFLMIIALSHINAELKIVIETLLIFH